MVSGELDGVYRMPKGMEKLSSWPSGSARWKYPSPHLASRGGASVMVLPWTGRLVKGIHIGDVEDESPPPGPVPAGGLDDDVEVAGADHKAGEGGVGSSVGQAMCRQ